MRKLLRGIIEFRRNRRPEYAATFARLALGQAPDALFVACSDSRVVPNLFASTEPGDLFVLRNVGNIVAPCGMDGASESDESEGAALEFSVLSLKVSDVIVCGHSECGAMRALVEGREKLPLPHMASWLRHAQPALDRHRSGAFGPSDLAPHNQVGQLNTLLQLEHLRSYPFIREAEEEGRIQLHAWWFDIAGADVYEWRESRKAFVLVDEQSIESGRRPVSG
ncbi:MAG TPA: carbonic anhydrase [Planctomycetota bacterium]|nr:carbonic anhydrase [Planctomycetota bacterium]